MRQHQHYDRGINRANFLRQPRYMSQLLMLVGGVLIGYYGTLLFEDGAVTG